MRALVILVTILLFSCESSTKKEKGGIAVLATAKTELEVYDFNGLQPFLKQQDTKIHVINFWATWCGPCVKELPHFEKIHETYKNQEVEVLLVSLDFPNQYDKKLKPFLEKNNIQSKVVVLDDVDMNTWIPKVDPTWSGALPATIIYKKGIRKFYEQSFTYQELEHELKQFLK